MLGNHASTIRPLAAFLISSMFFALQFSLYPPTFREWIMMMPGEARLCVEVRDSRTIDKIRIRGVLRRVAC